jgi:CubicO group peptidase (beta-lactamase class C family)
MWDDPATKHLPELQLFDPYVTRELTVRDLLTHRSGLSRADLTWYGSSFDRDELLRRVRFLEPSWSFRSRFGYQNLMFLAAGEVLETLSGKSWDEFVDERIFTPLGMTASNTSVEALRGQENVARPHIQVDGRPRAIQYGNTTSAPRAPSTRTRWKWRSGCGCSSGSAPTVDGRCWIPRPRARCTTRR